jgi:cobalt-zinc-cadmium efflux system outer membrane protein
MSLAMCLATLAILGAGRPVWAQTAPVAPARLTLEEATARALDGNAAYKARLLDRDVAASELDIAREHPNPDFSYENQRDAPYHAFLLDVPIELGGKRANRVRVGEASRDVVNAELGRGSADLRA